jgi:CheY-like chemotaxis protein
MGPAGSGDADRQRAAEAGFDVHLTKPPELHQLVKLLSSAARPNVTSRA